MCTAAGFDMMLIHIGWIISQRTEVLSFFFVDVIAIFLLFRAISMMLKLDSFWLGSGVLLAVGYR